MYVKEKNGLYTCRLCLFQGEANYVLSMFEGKCMKENVVEHIKQWLNITITKEDWLPTCICLSCMHQVTQWSNFYNGCQKSQTLLQARASKRNNVNNSDDELPTGLDNSSGSSSDSDESIFEIKEKKRTRQRRNVKIIKKRDIKRADDNKYSLELSDFPKNVYKCEICDKEFNDCFDYLDHQPEHDGQGVFICEKCKLVFYSRNELVEHDRNHRSPCPYCGKLILKTSMKLHLVKHANKHVCIDCKNSFNSSSALKQHIITVHTNIKNHVCDTCGKRFSSSTSVKVHMKSHSDERSYPCKLCSYAGRTSSALYVHMATHANDFCVCEICSKSFKSNRNLGDHLRRVHSKIKKHKCSYCEKLFVDKYSLTVHVRCHTGVRPYQCTQCDKAFIRSDGLKEHLLTHGQRNSHLCTECGKCFTSKRGIARHNCIAAQ